MTTKNARPNWLPGRFAMTCLVFLVCLSLILPTSLPGWAHTSHQASGPGQSTLDAAGAKIDAQVLAELQEQGHSDFFIKLKEKADLSPAHHLRTKQEKGRFVFNALREMAERSQRRLRTELDALGVDYRPYYIANKILVRDGSLDLAYQIAQSPEVEQIIPNPTFYLDEQILEIADGSSTDDVEPNLAFVNADDVWALGFFGQDIVLAANDTGIDWTHPALINQYRGWDGSAADHNYNWWDATGTYPNAPWDGNYHGTRVTGIMVGDDGESNRIGMAPGAQVIHCKMWRDDRSMTIDLILECLEWDLAPWDLNGENPDPHMAPDAINNSWGTYGGFLGMEDEIDALNSAGIFVAAAAGNEGPSCGSITTPAEYAQVLGVGTVDHASGVLPGILMPIHGRGSFDRAPQGFLPDVLAPGGSLRSSYPGGIYTVGVGFTSGATPHTVGLVGLIWSANPEIKGKVAETMQIIRDTAVPLAGQRGSSCGGDYLLGPNNDWGAGTIDALAAVQHALQYKDTGTVSGVVQDSGTGYPIWGATLEATLEDGLVWRAFSDVNGIYTRSTYPGTHTLTAYAYGYLAQTFTGIDVGAGTPVIQDFSLEPANSYRLTGTVSDAIAGWPLYAQLKIYGNPVDPPEQFQNLWTDPVTGGFQIELAAGIAYTIEVQAFSPGYINTSYTVGALSDHAAVNIQLMPDLTTCSAPGYQKKGGCHPLTGGLVVGNVYDANNDSPVNNALIRSSDGGQVYSSGTPADPAVADGFYILFSPAGNRMIIASGTYGYGEELKLVIVRSGSVTSQDFHLPAGELVIQPQTLEVTLKAGESTTKSITLTNLGELPVNLTVLEIPGPAGQEPLQTNGVLPWNAATPIPGGVMEYASAQCAQQPDFYYILGGVGSAGAPTVQAWRYDLRDSTWTALAPLPSARAQAAAACYGNQIYLAGGFRQFIDATDDLFIYNIASDTWEVGPDLPVPTRGAALGAWDNQLFLVGGIGDLALTGVPYNWVHIYQIASKSWIPYGGKALPAGVSFPGWVQAGPHLYLVGGCGITCPSENSFFSLRYSMSKNMWSIGPGFTSRRARFALAVTESHLYAIAGDPNGIYGGRFYGTTALVESLDLRDWPRSEWVDIGYPLPHKVNSNTAGFCTQSITGGEIWSVGGSLGIGYPLDANLYHPSEACYKQTGEVSWLSAQPGSLWIEPGGSQTITISLAAPVEVSETTCFEAELRLSNDSPYGSIDIPLRMSVEPASPGEYGVAATPAHQTGSACPGDSATYTLTVRNTGLLTDTYMISVNGRWEVQSPVDTGPLASGEEVEIVVLVSVPSKFKNVKSDLTTLTFTSHVDPEVTATATLLTEVNRICK